MKVLFFAVLLIVMAGPAIGGSQAAHFSGLAVRRKAGSANLS